MLPGGTITVLIPDAEIPTCPGSYLLLLHAARQTWITIGSLGRMQVQTGFYLYTGSAFGPGGLRSRLGRHFSQKKRLHWHIDYLLQAAQPLEAWIAVEEKRCEHEWALALCARAEITIPLPRFGSSDCRCPAHLFYSSIRPKISPTTTVLIQG